MLQGRRLVPHVRDAFTGQPSQVPVEVHPAMEYFDDLKGVRRVFENFVEAVQCSGSINNRLHEPLRCCWNRSSRSPKTSRGGPLIPSPRFSWSRPTAIRVWISASWASSWSRSFLTNLSPSRKTSETDL